MTLNLRCKQGASEDPIRFITGASSQTPTMSITISPQDSLSEQLTTYKGNCHCGAIKYTMQIVPPLSSQEVVSCNCSICTKNGYMMVYPKRDNVVFHSGYDDLVSYAFGDAYNHKFCPTCGSSVMAEPSDGDICAINVSDDRALNSGTIKADYL